MPDKYQGLILQYERVSRRRNLRVGKYPHAPISHCIKCRRPPSAFQHVLFWSSLINISINVPSNYQGPILQYKGVSLRQNFWVGKYPHAPISHSTKRPRPPSAFQLFPLWSSLDSISIYMISKYQGPILQYEGVSRRWNFWVGNYPSQITLIIPTPAPIASNLLMTSGVYSVVSLWTSLLPWYASCNSLYGLPCQQWSVLVAAS